MCTLLVEVVLGVPFGYEPTDELKKLLEDFREMINFCIDYAHKRRITSYARLRKGVLRAQISGREKLEG
jgi:putative transposase